MSRIVAVTPRLSDAVLSCGATLARHAAEGHEVVALCLFGAAGGADDEAARHLGLGGVIHVTIDAAAQRGYEGHLGTYKGVDEADEAPRLAVAALALSIDRLAPDLVLAPLGLGGDVDHDVTLAALETLEVDRLRWLDLPYALSRTPGAPLGAGELVAVPVGEHLDAKLAACALYAEPAVVDRIEDHARDAGRRAGADEPLELLLSRPGGGE